MGATSSLRMQPSSENCVTLFSIQRILTLQSDILSALPLCAKKISEACMPCEVIIALAENAHDEIGIVAAAPESAQEAYGHLSIRMGTFPCGLALEKEELVDFAIEGKRPCFESPIRNGRRIAGAMSLIASPGFSGARLELAKELLQWTCYLIEEALGLRAALMQRCASALPYEASSQTAAAPERVPAMKGVSFHGIIGNSDSMKEVYTLIGQVAGTDATVLILGESGTGKELVAKAIHECGDRSKGPFIAINCAALPESIIESELFGHEKGAFTGAIAARQGRFEAARDGTLFLDEIGDLSLAVQVKLLRILQERSFERVGGNKAIRTNARIIAATHRDLKKAVEEGSFREDLYFRLNVFPLHIPPLRERGADILLLADHFAEKFGSVSGRTIKRISSPALDLLMIYHWPGNVRELENCIARAGIVTTDGVIHSYNLPPSLQSATSTGTEPMSTFDGAIARLEKEMLVEALKIERGNSASAARRLGITERRFRFALQHYKVDYRGYRTKM
ncbi:MAG: sigma-54-dependent Fis family transcriptional regulator [Spirochaetae bacterium HGW-Spirochaetae-9]|nr:MAG: sigma-54-dependent Fis family transcriptional regulator [Spirochaetae bacterium HGW-Spirochaetae-9]